MTFKAFITLSKSLLITGVGGTGFVASAQAVDVQAIEVESAKAPGI